MMVPRETEGRLKAYEALVRDENQRHNLVSRASLEQFRERHIDDSAQLLPLSTTGTWVDLGSGAGLPGIVLAILGAHVTLVESRTLRHIFLGRCIEELGLEANARLHAGRVETMRAQPFGVITARAFAPLPQIFAAAVRFASTETTWVLPKGRNAESELAATRESWHGDFRLVPSTTDPQSSIIVARGVRPRNSR
jgi:16S rRNA (guanine527-N7)-methyltransferase